MLSLINSIFIWLSLYIFPFLIILLLNHWYHKSINLLNIDVANYIDSKKSAVYSLVENLQREDLNFFEEANAINNLLAITGCTQEEISKLQSENESLTTQKESLESENNNLKEQIKQKFKK